MLVETIGTVENEETINLENFTDDDLEILYEKILNEKRTRKENKRIKLINDFEHAFDALKEAGIDINIVYYDEEGDYYDHHLDFDDIEFI